jgi:hypothetical protein
MPRLDTGIVAMGVHAPADELASGRGDSSVSSQRR